VESVLALQLTVTDRVTALALGLAPCGTLAASAAPWPPATEGLQ
jgi:hypothetical protein